MNVFSPFKSLGEEGKKLSTKPDCLSQPSDRYGAKHMGSVFN